MSTQNHRQDTPDLTGYVKTGAILIGLAIVLAIVVPPFVDFWLWVIGIMNGRPVS